MEHPAQLPVGVAPAGFEFDPRGGGQLLRIGGIELGAGEIEPVHEQPHPVPGQRLHTTPAQRRTQLRHRMGTCRHPENADLIASVESCQRVLPAAFQRRTDCHRVRVPRHDRHDAAVGNARAQRVQQGLRLREIAQNAVAQHRIEAHAVHGRFRARAVGLHERHPPLDLRGKPGEALACLAQHRLRRIEERDLMTGLRQRERLMPGTASDVEDARGRRRNVLEKLVVHDVGAHVPLDGRVGTVSESVGQGGPVVLVHLVTIGGSPRFTPVHSGLLRVGTRREGIADRAALVDDGAARPGAGDQPGIAQHRQVITDRPQRVPGLAHQLSCRGRRS